MSSALAELILRKKDQFATMAVLEIAFIGISKNDLLDLMNVIENELQRFNGFQVDALAQTIKLCFPLDVDKNGIQNAAETGLALCQFFNEIPNCKFVLILRTGTYELNFSKEDNIEYPLLVIKDFTVQKRPEKFSYNDVFIDQESYQTLSDLYDLRHTGENYYSFIDEKLAG